MDRRIHKLILAALFAALCYVLTMVVQIPAPTGYVNLGDCAVLLGAWVLGPLWGGAAAGIGAGLADLLSGYGSYAPGTLVIKFAMAAVAALVFRSLRERKLTGRVVSAVLAELIMAGGYFLYESLILGVGAAAAASVPANLVQGVAGVVSAVAVATLLDRAKVLERLA